MVIPSDEEIRALHEKYAPTPEAFALVYTHCEIVCAVAEQLLDRSGLALNRSLVRAGCLLHDIGVYRLFGTTGRLDHAHYVSHGVLGHEILAGEGLPGALCRFCSHHTGVGLTRVDVREQGLPIPEKDYVAESPEEELVMYADKFHSKRNPPVFVTADSYAASVARFGEEKVIRFKEMRTRFGTPELNPLVAAYGHSLVGTSEETPPATDGGG
ncbi:HD domain-containing protein [Nocardiopsis sp. NRRL B-16309]|uniref:HD domain-containing protein n=1 Tax=Nocardiopsis sp. NRRL B-16309 TaxID=1519494 RepID=UPI0006AE241D|nr:HD domain-containing protein [Nocardiopsis sp. NRRL B-16309]KOX09958.1 phosphohydrolase [Nocardiopsis sp. NRRL B-16309]